MVFKASNEREIDAAFTAITQAKISAMLVGSGEFLTSRRRQIIQSAALHKIPAIYSQRLHTEAGGLMSYGAGTTDAWRRAGVYVARILKGEKPAIFRSSCRPNSSWSSISRPPRRSDSTFLFTSSSALTS